MSEIVHEAEFFHITPVDLSPMPRDGYREVADFLLNQISKNEQISQLEIELSHERHRHSFSKKRAELADIDALTGLKNLRAFNEYFPTLCDEMSRDNVPLAIFYIDTDGQKRVNEDKQRCGYEVGSRLIKLVGERALTIIRIGDDIFRIYGDEWVVVATDFAGDHPEYNFSQRIDRMHTVRDRFETTINNGIQTAEYIPEDLHVGVSVGCALQRPGETSDAFLKRAEINMDERKRERREELLARGIRFGDSRLFADS